MRKADAELVEQLISSDEAERVVAAARLDELEDEHFYHHRMISLGSSHPWIAALVAAWHASTSPRVRLWSAQLLALMGAATPEAAAVVASAAADEGDYAEDVVRHICTYRRWVPELDDILRTIHHHPSAGVRSRLALHLAGYSELCQPERRPMIHELMRDPSTLPRGHAVRALGHMPTFDADDVMALLDVIAMDADARAHAASLLAKIATLPGCDPAGFPKPKPALRFDGVYAATFGDLDAEGRWSEWECLRFYADGRVEATQPASLGPGMSLLRDRPLSPVAWGVATVTDDGMIFSLEGRRGVTAYTGVIDGHVLVLARTDGVTGKTVEVRYAHVHIVWDRKPTPERQARLERNDKREATRLAGLAKKGIPFPVPPPKSMLSASASRWYKQMTARLPSLVAGEATARDRIHAAWEVKRMMRDAAAAALLDPAIKPRFLATMDLPELDTLLALDEERAMTQLLAFTKTQQRAFPRTSSEETDIVYWDGVRVWVMAESGWVLRR